MIDQWLAPLINVSVVPEPPQKRLELERGARGGGGGGQRGRKLKEMYEGQLKFTEGWQGP